MQTKIYLKPILSDGKPILIDLQGKKFNWPTSTPGNARNVRLCDAAIKNDNAVKVRQVEDQLHYGTAPIANYIGKDAIVTDFPLLTETQIVALVSVDAEQQVMLNFIHNESVQLKPQQLIVNVLKWKYL